MDSLVMAPMDNASNVSFEPRYFLRIREYREWLWPKFSLLLSVWGEIQANQSSE